jgi:hypothetical protein
MVAPAVPEHLARLRFFIAATHTDEQLAATVRLLVAALAELAGDAADAERAAQAVPA